MFHEYPADPSQTEMSFVTKRLSYVSWERNSEQRLIALGVSAKARLQHSIQCPAQSRRPLLHLRFHGWE